LRLSKIGQVIFEGETTWEYEEWSGPLFSVSGTNIAVSGASGHSLNGNGAKWWDGEGSSKSPYLKYIASKH
jgi:polygalacturonase